ncbi:hypothetical protein [Deinococcus cellulosilyticus]|uniref:Haloacid dehalogenase n=1 Tax=Deinococcus cellulosilyticus (strain DSM 18568 / NBRC 106333 / KACC 11606 / 5516J-15) TaxID=1223518 RepID=A0A511N794_DEIC1|nr:hypothetical protein [Deinococcus cellulosilyticus]GEM48715.1 hypothetical protein DC3_43500 [Deinococcus cellulosilyticus NBRC 106333 = KACC 11606]
MIVQALQTGVAVDIDGTIASTVNALTEILQSQGVGPQHFRPNTDPECPSVFIARNPHLQTTLDQMVRTIFQREEVYQAATPIPGALEGVVALQQANFFRGYVTRRPSHLQKVTLDWLQSHGFPAGDVLHVKDPSKSTLMNQLNARCIIEDSFHEVWSLFTDHHGLLIDTDYNRLPLPNNVTRCNWQAIARAVG